MSKTKKSGGRMLGIRISDEMDERLEEARSAIAPGTELRRTDTARVALSKGRELILDDGEDYEEAGGDSE